jgi:hypothetical protein
MSLCVVLLKLKLWILYKDLVHYRDNNSSIRAFIYCLLILLPKQSSVPSILPTYRPPKHPSNLPLVVMLYTILIIDFFFPNFACYLGLCMFSRLCPRLITPKDLILLLIYPANMFSCLIKSLSSILFRKRTLLPRNTLYKSLLFKCCIYCFLTTIKAKDTRNYCPWNFTVLLRGCCLLD